MADYADDVARLAEMLREGTAVVGAWTLSGLARHLLEQGVTLPPPPPDPAVVVARWLAEPAETGNLEAAVRDLFPADALKAAAAKVQEAEG